MLCCISSCRYATILMWLVWMTIFSRYLNLPPSYGHMRQDISYWPSLWNAMSREPAREGKSSLLAFQGSLQWQFDPCDCAALSLLVAALVRTHEEWPPRTWPELQRTPRKTQMQDLRHFAWESRRWNSSSRLMPVILPSFHSTPSFEL